jgi:4-amino-4-deoxy-L-arabinose transferase-like glycosyltransferase
MNYISTAYKIIDNFKIWLVDLKHSVVLHLFLFFIVVWTRFVFLGYSDYQGDEIKAMFQLTSGQFAWQFLLDQKKGPMQFLVTAFMHIFTPDYLNNFLLRLPFAVAGFLAVFYFYKLVNLHFGRKIALYSTMLFSLSGFMIAFSRIVQYQSFTILFSIIALYQFSKALFKEEFKFRGWYLGAFYWALGALFHYDAIFVFPFTLYIFIRWYKRYSHIATKDKILAILGATSITLGMLALFYVPYFFSLGTEQISYWLGRIDGADTGKISDSLYIFRIYNPTFIYLLYFVLLGFSFFNFRKNWPVILWAAFPFLFMELLVSIPGTHIYTYLIPVFILCAFGIVATENLFMQIVPNIKAKKIFDAGLALLFLFMFLLMHTVFIDHRVEYPWDNKKFLLWDLQRPSTYYHLSLFGFPYNRQWEDIGKYLKATNVYKFSTNERSPITRFYLEDFDRDGNFAEAFIYIYNPQSFNFAIDQDKSYYWVRIQKYDANLVLTKDGNPIVKIYNMPGGSLPDIDFLGY